MLIRKRTVFQVWRQEPPKEKGGKSMWVKFSKLFDTADEAQAKIDDFKKRGKNALYVTIRPKDAKRKAKKAKAAVA